jgi:hypothetical protein
MSQKLKDAVEKTAEHGQALEELNESLDTTQLEAWRSHVAAWQKDHSVTPDPYQELFEGLF